MRPLFRRIALLAAFAAPFTVASAQKSFGVGSKILSVGLLGGGSTGYGIGAGGSFEVGAKEMSPDWTLGIGGMIGYTSKTYSAGGVYDYKWTTLPIAAIANAHYKLKDNPKADLYGGLSLGFVHYSFSSDFAGFHSADVGGSSDLALGINVGGRYDFSQKVAGMLQLSGGSHFPLYFVGLTFKM